MADQNYADVQFRPIQREISQRRGARDDRNSGLAMEFVNLRRNLQMQLHARRACREYFFSLFSSTSGETCWAFRSIMKMGFRPIGGLVDGH